MQKIKLNKKVDESIKKYFDEDLGHDAALLPAKMVIMVQRLPKINSLFLFLYLLFGVFFGFTSFAFKHVLHLRIFNFLLFLVILIYQLQFLRGQFKWIANPTRSSQLLFFLSFHNVLQINSHSFFYFALILHWFESFPQFQLYFSILIIPLTLRHLCSWKHFLTPS